jgi:hypothetical protein
MLDAVNRLVERLGALDVQLRLDFRDAPEECQPALVAADEGLVECAAQLAGVVRCRADDRGARDWIAQQIWTARRRLRSARLLVNQAHALVESARQARERAHALREDDTRRRERLQRRRPPSNP